MAPASLSSGYSCAVSPLVVTDSLERARAVCGDVEDRLRRRVQGALIVWWAVVTDGRDVVTVSWSPEEPIPDGTFRLVCGAVPSDAR